MKKQNSFAKTKILALILTLAVGLLPLFAIPASAGSPEDIGIAVSPDMVEIGDTVHVSVRNLNGETYRTLSMELFFVLRDGTELLITRKSNDGTAINSTENFDVVVRNGNVVRIRVKACVSAAVVLTTMPDDNGRWVDGVWIPGNHYYDDYPREGYYPRDSIRDEYSTFTVIRDANIFVIGDDPDWEWYIANNEAIITRYIGTAGNATVPEKLGGKPVTAMEDNVFGANVGSVKISNSVRSISDYTFQACKNLSTITVDGGNAHFVTVGGVLFDRNKTTLYRYPPAMGGEQYTIPEGTRTILSTAFAYCKSLGSVTVPNSVASLKYSAFMNCANLSVAYFKHDNGNTVEFGANVFQGAASGFKIIYPAASTGFTTPKWHGYPAEPDGPPPAPPKDDNTLKAEEAVRNVRAYIDRMSREEKESSDGVDILILFAENEILKASTKEVTGGDIQINSAATQDLQTQAARVKALIEDLFIEKGIQPLRYMRAGVGFKTVQTKNTIRIDPSVTSAPLDSVAVLTPDYSVSVPKKTLLADVKTSSLTITVEEIFATRPGYNTAQMETPRVFAAQNEVQYKVTTLSKDLTQNVTYSFKPVSGDVNYQAAFRSNDTPVVSKYNPVTYMIDTKIKFNDTYTVKENRKDFSDIKAKSTEMQEAIKKLATSDIIKGSSATTFSPDNPITRAEITALIVRTLSMLDDNADGKFSDVKKSDWFFSAVGSAKALGIINGTSATTFEPNKQILKEQIIAIAARTLRIEMNYKTPQDREKYLSKFTDRKSLPTWGIDDFALASMANLIVLRQDGKFMPAVTMTRGEAAVVICRLFNKLW